MTTTKNTITEMIQEFLNGLKTNYTEISDFVNTEDITDYSNAFQDILKILEDNNALNVDVIYYATAIEYLSLNDPSLSESLSIANEMGYTIENLNSEVLASLLASQNNREEFQELEEEISNFFAELE